MPNLFYSVLVLVNVCICWNSYAPADPPHGVLNIFGDVAGATGHGCPHSSATGCLRIKELQLCQQHASRVAEKTRMKNPNQPDGLYRFHVQNLEFHHDPIHQTLRARFPDASVAIHNVLLLFMEEGQEWTVFGTNSDKDITLKSEKIFTLIVCAHCISEPTSLSEIVFLVFARETSTSTSVTRLLNPLDHTASFTATNDKMVPHNPLPSSADFHLTTSVFALWLVAHLHMLMAPLPVIMGGFPPFSEISEGTALLTLKPMYVTSTSLHPLFDYCNVTPTALNISNLSAFHHRNCDAGFFSPITEIFRRLLPNNIRFSRCYLRALWGQSPFNQLDGNAYQLTLRRFGRTPSSQLRGFTGTDVQTFVPREYRLIGTPFMNTSRESPSPQSQAVSIRTSLVPVFSHDAHTLPSEPNTSSIPEDLTESKAHSFKADLLFRILRSAHGSSNEQSAFPSNHALPEDINSSMMTVLSSEVRWFGTFKPHSDLVVESVPHITAQLVPPFLRTLHFEFTDRLVNSFCAQLRNIPAYYSNRMNSHSFHETGTNNLIDALSNFSVHHLLTLSNTGNVPVFVTLLTLGPDSDASFNPAVAISSNSDQDALTCVYSSFRLLPCVVYVPGNKSQDRTDSRSSFMILKPGERVPLELQYQPDFARSHSTASLWFTAFPYPQMREGAHEETLLRICDNFATCDAARVSRLSVFRFSANFPTDVLRNCSKISPQFWIEQLIWTPSLLLFAMSLLVTIFMGSMDARRIHTAHVKICNRMDRLSMNLPTDTPGEADSSHSSSGASSKRLACDVKLSRTAWSQRAALPANASSMVITRRRHQHPLTFLFSVCVSVLRLMLTTLKWAYVHLPLLRTHQQPQRTGPMLSQQHFPTVSSFCVLKRSKELLRYFIDRFASSSEESFTHPAVEGMKDDRAHNEVRSPSHPNACCPSGLKSHRNPRRFHSSNSSASSGSHFPDASTVIRRRRGYLKSDPSITIQSTSELKIYGDTTTSNCSPLLKDFPSSLPKAADTGGEPVVARMTEAKIAAAVRATMRLAEESGHQGRRKTNAHKQTAAKKYVYFACNSPSIDPLLTSSRKRDGNGRSTDSESSNPMTDTALSEALNIIPGSSLDDISVCSAPKECSSSHPQYKKTSLQPNWSVCWPSTSVGATHNSSKLYSSMSKFSAISSNDSIIRASSPWEQNPTIPLGSILAHLVDIPGRGPDRSVTDSPAFSESVFESSPIPPNAVDCQGTHISSCWPRNWYDPTLSYYSTSQEHPVESDWETTRVPHDITEVGFPHTCASEVPCLGSSVVTSTALDTVTFAPSGLLGCSEFVSNPLLKDPISISPSPHQGMYTELAIETSRHGESYHQGCLASPTSQAFLYELPQITQTMRLSMLMHETRDQPERSEHPPAASESLITERLHDQMKHDSNAIDAYTKDLSDALYDQPSLVRSLHPYCVITSTLEHDHESAGIRQHPANTTTLSNFAVTYRPWVPITSLSRNELLDELGLKEIDSLFCNKSSYPTEDHISREHSWPEIASDTVNFYTELAASEIGSQNIFHANLFYPCLSNF
ncbi:unnamed protein product [Dicrocoelium dendriticum]|nr:unnamed protein product [Dicrocoelium dendriticum]